MSQQMPVHRHVFERMTIENGLLRLKLDRLRKLLARHRRELERLHDHLRRGQSDRRPIRVNV